MNRIAIAAISAALVLFSSIVPVQGTPSGATAKKTQASPRLQTPSPPQSTPASQQNPFDGTWVGKTCVGWDGNGERMGVTIFISGAGTRVDVKMLGRGFSADGYDSGSVGEKLYTSKKPACDGRTVKWADGWGVWALTPNSDGKTAHFTCDWGGGYALPACHSSETFQKVSPSSTVSSTIPSTAAKSKKAEAPGAATTASLAGKNKKGTGSDSFPSVSFRSESKTGMTPDEAESLLEGKAKSAQTDTPSGFYKLENEYSFNVLDSVYYDRGNDQLSLIGHLDNRFSGRKIPYLQHLATLLESSNPQFSLAWTSDSEKRIEGLFAHSISQSESDSITKEWGKLYDNEGNLTKAGYYLLPAFGVSPIFGNKLPGSMGIKVVPEPGTLFVRVSEILPSSPAVASGVRVGDVIRSVNEVPPCSPEEFDHSIRLRGAGGTVQFKYSRSVSSQPIYTGVTLTQSDDRDVWSGTYSEDVPAALYYAAGNNKAAQCSQIAGTLDRLNVKYHVPEKVSTILEEEMIYLMGIMDDLREAKQAGAAHSQAIRTAFFGKECRAMDATYDFGGTPIADAFNQAVRRGYGPDQIVAATTNELKRQLLSKIKHLLDSIFDRPEGLQIPPELVEDHFHIHPEMAPQYLGIDGHSLLARAMFSGDYLLKRLMNRPDLKQTIPGYQTGFEFEVKHPEFHHATGNYRIWASVDKMDTPQSADGKTLAFRDVRIRFNIRDEIGRSSDGSGRDLTNKAGSYEELLTSLWDELEPVYPTLHELRESAKLAATAKWILTQNPSATLPKEGRVHWQGPPKVPGLVFYEMTTDASRATKTKVTIIANGGVSLVPFPKAGVDNPFPIDSSVVDLRDLGNGTNTPAGNQVMSIKFNNAQAAREPAPGSSTTLIAKNVPRDLSHDPVAARLSKTQLDQVEARIGRLQNAIDFLSYNANPEWEREWKNLADDVQKNARAQFQLGCDGLSAGLARTLEVSTVRNAKLAKKAVDLPIWDDLRGEERELERLASSSAMLKGPAGDGLRKTIAAMKRLEAARNAENTAEALSKVRDVLSSGDEAATSIAKDPTIANALYQGSAMIGVTASLFTSAAIKEATAPFDLTLKVGEAALLLKEAHEEDQQYASLSQHSYDRRQTQMELEKRMGELQEERTRLKWAVEKAQ